MNRKDFLKSILGGAVVAAISPMLIVEEPTDYNVINAAIQQINNNGYRPYCYSFKITKKLYDSLVTQNGRVVGITDPLHPLDELCKDLTGYPIKEIGFEGDDFAHDTFTVVSFRMEIENEKQLKA